MYLFMIWNSVVSCKNCALIIFLQIDDANDAKDLTELLNKVRRDLVTCADNLSKSLDANNLDDARKNLITFRYYVSLENSIKEKSSRLGIHL